MAVKDKEYQEVDGKELRSAVTDRLVEFFEKFWERQNGKGTKILIPLAMIATLLLATTAVYALTNYFILGIFAGLIIDVIIFLAWITLTMALYNPNVRGVDIEGTYGDALIQKPEDVATSKDVLNTVIYADSYDKMLDNIIGKDPILKNRLYGAKRVRGMNGNWIIFGSPGSGKSVSIAVPTIMQTIRRGESLIVTDPKGELYGLTANMAKAHGYIVKVINFNPRNMLHSDSADFMGVIGNDTIKAQSFAKTIISNTEGSDKIDFWGNQELNVLTAEVLRINTSSSLPAEKKTFPEVYNQVVTNDATTIAENYDLLPPTSPAKQMGMLYANSSEKVQTDTRGGLGVRLSSLSNPILQQICGTKDIDFSLPGREKCIYYVCSSDHDASLAFYQSLFFTLLIQELSDYADDQKSQSLPVKVTLLLDEFKNIGKIPMLPQTLATCRGRNIDIMMILQDIGQLKVMYPNEEWTSIINCCSFCCCLRTNDVETAKYFSERAGIKSIYPRSVKYEGSTSDWLKDRRVLSYSESPSKANAINADQILRLENDEILIFVSGKNPIILHKAYYFDHPMNLEMRPTNVKMHMGAWVEKLIAEGDLEDLKLYGINGAEDIKDNWLPLKFYDDILVQTIDVCDQKTLATRYNNSMKQDNYENIIRKLQKLKDEERKERVNKVKLRVIEMIMYEYASELKEMMENGLEPEEEEEFEASAENIFKNYSIENMMKM